jgi:hypothetical protein
VLEATGGEVAEEIAAEDGVIYTTAVSVLVCGDGVFSTVVVVVVVDTMLVGGAVSTTVVVTRCVRDDEGAETVSTVVFGGKVEVTTAVSTTVTGETPDPDPEAPSMGTTEYLGIRGFALACSTIGNDQQVWALK